MERRAGATGATRPEPMYRGLATPATQVEDAHPVLDWLYILLLDPVLSSDGSSALDRIVVVPNAVLSYLPFPALTDPGSFTVRVVQ